MAEDVKTGENPEVETKPIDSQVDKDTTSDNLAKSAEVTNEAEDEVNKSIAENKEATADKPMTAAQKDFYDEFMQRRAQAQFVSDLQSADTYWENRPEERKKYEDEYGAEAKAKFEDDYKNTIEPLWRAKLQENQNEVALNQHFEWLFGDGKNYDPKTVLSQIRAIDTGETILGDVMTEKQITDQQAALDSKTFMNDKGELVKLDDDEKWWKWSAGSGTEMDQDNPRYKSSDGRKIVGFEQVQFEPLYRGQRYVKAIYSGDKPTGPQISVWDTTNWWLLNNDSLKPSGVLKEIPKIGMRVVTNTAVSLLSSACNLLALPATWLDDDDDNGWTNFFNDEAITFNSAKIAKNEYDKQHTITTGNVVEFVANVVAQLYAAKGMGEMAMSGTKILKAGNPLLVKAAELQKAGKVKEAEQMLGMFEMSYARVARNASTWGMALMQGNDIVTSARAAGFDEDAVGAIYVAFLGAMGAAAKISTSLVDPWITGKVARPFYAEMAKNEMATLKLADDLATTSEAKDKLRMKWAKNLVGKMVDKAKVAGYVGMNSSNKIAAIALPALTEAMEEETEWALQEAVQTGATIISKYTSKDKDNYAKFQTVFDKGYLASQLPNILLSGVGGALGGGIAGFMPGFHHENETQFLVKGTDAEKMIKTAILGGDFEKQFLTVLKKSYKSGVLGPKELSVKLNPETGKYYKMTDAEAKGTLSQADAAYNLITGQYSYYKALYGDSGYSFDQLMKIDPSLKDIITNAKENELTSMLAKAHQDYRDLVGELLKDKPSVEPLSTKKSKEESKAEKKAEKQSEKEASKDKTGKITEEVDLEAEAKDSKEAAEAFSDEVKSRAALYGTTKYRTVEAIMAKEAEINDIVTGKAAGKLLMKAMIRTGDNALLKVFDPDAASELFISDKFKNFSGDLLQSIFTADETLAANHSARRASYVKDRDVVANMIHDKLSPEVLAHLAKMSVNSIPLDPLSDDSDELYQKTYELVDKLFTDKDLEEIVATVRKKHGLENIETADLEKEFSDKLQARFDGLDETVGKLDEIAEKQDIRDEYVNFIQDNKDLVYKLGVSRYIDSAKASKMEFIMAKLSTDKNAIINNVVGKIEMNSSIESGYQSFIGIYDELKTQYDALVNSKPTTEAEIIEKETKLRALRPKLNEAKRNAILYQDGLNSVEDFTLTNGKVDYDDFSTRAAGMFATAVYEESTKALSIPLIEKTDALNATPYMEVINNYIKIKDNLSPEVPEIPINGAIENLLNEITVSDKNVISTDNKIINTEDDDDQEDVDNFGNTTKLRQAKSVVQDLLDSRLRKGTPFEEFRRLEDAKMARDAVLVRVAQVALMKQMSPTLNVLQQYMSKYSLSDKRKYSVIPTFMERYMFDSKRVKELSEKKILSLEEQRDKDILDSRMKRLLDDETGVVADLQRAFGELSYLIQLGEDSLTANKRVLAYKEEAKEAMTSAKQVFERVSKATTIPELRAKILAFNSITDLSNDDNLTHAHDLYVDILSTLGSVSSSEALHIASDLKDIKYADVIYGALNKIRGRLNPEDEFNKNYNAVLAERVAAGEKLLPTVPQEVMIKEAFNFMVDGYTNEVDYPNKLRYMLFVGGFAGTGKTTMIGYSIATAQKLMASLPNSKPGTNKVYAVSNYAESAINLKNRLRATGCNVKEQNYGIVKRDLYKMLVGAVEGNPDYINAFDDVSIIAYDEATMIQAVSEGTEDTELSKIHRKIDQLNEIRSQKGLLPLRMLLIGDSSQGTWNESMPAIDASDEEWINWEKNGQDNKSVRRSPTVYSMMMDTTTPLKYTFRTLCPKTTEFAEELKSKVAFIGAIQTSTSVPKAAYSVISNDPVRNRLGGVKVTKIQTDLYDDQEVIDNIKSQIEKDKNFSVIIVDNSKHSLKDFSTDTEFGKLVKSNPSNFKLYTTGSVQGMEADYVIADLSSKLVTFPPVSSDIEQYNVAAMVVSRARLFAKIATAPTMRIDVVKNAVVNMLEDAEADALAKEWNEFYLTRYRKVPEGKIHEESTKEEEEEAGEPQKPEEPEKSEEQEKSEEPEKPEESEDEDPYNSTKFKPRNKFESKGVHGVGTMMSKTITVSPAFQYTEQQVDANHPEITGNDIGKDAATEVRALERLGYTLAYRQLFDRSTDECIKQALYYSHDLFGGTAYKDFDGGIAQDRIDEYKVMLNEVEKHPKKYDFTLISYQNYSRIDDRVNIDHAICVIYNNVPYFLYQLDSPEEDAADNNADWVKFLKTRKNILKSISANMIDASMTGDAFAPNTNILGKKGYINANKSFDKILTDFVGDDIKPELAELHNTRIFRTHVSGENQEYAMNKLHSTQYKSGTIIMETLLPANAAAALYKLPSTAGKLFRTVNNKSKFRYSSTGKKLSERLGDSELNPNLIEKVTLNKSDYYIHTEHVVDDNNQERDITFILRNRHWEQLVDIDSKGNPVIVLSKNNPDIEVVKIGEALTFTNGEGKLRTPNTATLVGKTANTTVEILKNRLNPNKKPVVQLLEDLKKSRALEAGDETITLDELKRRSPDVSFSMPLVITNRAIGNEALIGKSFVLYSTNPDIKLDTLDDVEKALGKVKIIKASNYVNTPEDFDISKFARDGVGILMLDSPMVSLKTIVKTISNKAAKPISYSSNSAVSKNMFDAVASISKLLLDIETPTERESMIGNFSRLGKMNTRKLHIEEAKIKELKANSDLYNAITKVFYHATIDANLGSHILSPGGDLASIKYYLEQGDTESAKKTFDSIKEKAPAELEGINTVEEFDSKYATPQEIGYDIKSNVLSTTGELITKGDNRIPIIGNTHGAPMTFMLGSEDLGTKDVRSFNMTNFAQLINQYGKIDSKTNISEDIASWIDDVLTSNFKEFNKGILWSGNINRDFSNRNLGVAVLDPKTTLGDLTTSVKLIGRRSAIIDINTLMKNAYVEEVPESHNSKEPLKKSSLIVDDTALIKRWNMLKESTKEMKTAEEFDPILKEMSEAIKKNNLNDNWTSKLKGILTTIYREVKTARDGLKKSKAKTVKYLRQAIKKQDGTVTVAYNFTTDTPIANLRDQVNSDIQSALEDKENYTDYAAAMTLALNKLPASPEIEELKNLILSNMPKESTTEELVHDLRTVANTKNVPVDISETGLDQIRDVCMKDKTSNERLRRIMANGFDESTEGQLADVKLLQALDLSEEDTEALLRILSNVKKTCIS